MSSGDYWKKREQEAKKETIRDEEEYRKRIETIYKQTYEAVERQINDWYARYASKNGLSMSEARMRVKKLDMERYERLAAKYVATHDFSDQANEEMEIYNLTMRINRLELLKAQINLELLAGYDDLDKELEREFIEQAMKEDRRLAGILGDSVIGNQRYAKQIVNASFWNATYSERIWGNNMPRLRSSIETQLRNGIIQGIHPTELARKLRQSFDVSIRDSERLMITEVRRIQTEIQKDSFDRNGFKEYRFISAGDGKVCPECERLHGQHFKVSEMQPGENAPPMHPVCRCSTAAWMDGEKYKRWLDAMERGEDVRWRDFESTVTEMPLSKRSDKINKKHRSARGLEKKAKEIREEMKEYTNNSSRWSGKIRVVSRINGSAGGAKNWNCDITGTSLMSDYVLWHEMLHSSSVSYYSEQDYKNNRIIEEGSVELLTREICLRKGIKIGDGYDDIVKTLYILCGFLEYPSRMEFARDLFNVPLPERYDWLEDRVRDKMIKDKFSIDQIEQGVQFLSIKFQGKML